MTYNRNINESSPKSLTFLILYFDCYYYYYYHMLFYNLDNRLLWWFLLMLQAPLCHWGHSVVWIQCLRTLVHFAKTLPSLKDVLLLYLLFLTLLSYRCHKISNVLYSSENVYLDDEIRFQPLSLAMYLRGEYSVGKFFIQPQFVMDYYFPADTRNLNTMFSVNVGCMF